MSKEPRWQMDCGGCKFSWSCGPVCACHGDKSIQEPPTQWHPAIVMGYSNSNFLMGEKKLYGVVEIKSKGKKIRNGLSHVPFECDEEIVFRAGTRNKKDIITPCTKWTKGIIRHQTNRFDGMTWGFYVLTIEPLEDMK